MTRIYFVRHGEGQDNVAGQFSCQRVDRPLTDRGRLQARQTAEAVARLPIEAIFCSPMKRAHETAQIIACRLNRDLTVLEEFREVNVGELEGRDFNDENWSCYHRITSEWYAGNRAACYPGGEDFRSLWARTQRGWQEILRICPDGNAVLVGHGGIFIATLKEFCPGLDIQWLQNAQYYHCAITELEVDPGNGELQGRIVRWADYSHMSEEALSRAAAIPPLTSLKST